MITLNDTNSHTHTLDKTSLDEGSAHRRTVYLHNTQHSRETNIHAPGGIRNRNPRNRVAADLRQRPRGHRNWQI